MPVRRLALLAALAGAGPAQAAPIYLPTQDVSVEYRLDVQGPHPDVVKMDYSARAGRARIASAGMPLYAIVDRRGGRLTLVVDLLHAFVEQPFDPSEGYGLHIGRDAAFTRLGEGRVAGEDCRDWQVRTAQGEATACLTPDGVILRADFAGRRGKGRLEAVRISRAPQPAALFAVPDGYSPLAPDLLPLLGRGLLPEG